MSKKKKINPVDCRKKTKQTRDWQQLTNILELVYNGITPNKEALEWLEKQPKMIRKAVRKYWNYVTKNKKQLQKRLNGNDSHPNEDYTYPKYDECSLYRMTEYRGRILLEDAYALDSGYETPNKCFDIEKFPTPYYGEPEWYFPVFKDGESYFLQADSICRALDYIRKNGLWLTIKFRISAIPDSEVMNEYPTSKPIICSWSDCDGSMTYSEMVISLYNLILATIPTILDGSSDTFSSYAKYVIAKSVLGYISLLTDDITHCSADERIAYHHMISNPIFTPNIYCGEDTDFSAAYRSIEIVDCFATKKSLGDIPEWNPHMVSVKGFIPVEFNEKEDSDDIEGNAE